MNVRAALQDGLSKPAILDVLIIKDDPEELVRDMMSVTPPPGLLAWH
jgi:hypothetical protein